WALSVAAAALLTFWSARHVLTHNHPRMILRGVAAAGLVAAPLALVQHATSPTLLYWTFRPLDRGATPYSPFVNRNDLATWVIMAAPLTIGYAVARVHSAYRRANRPDLESMMDVTEMWLIAAVCLMLGALVASTSRSGLIGGAVGLASFGGLALRQMTRSGRP